VAPSAIEEVVRDVDGLSDEYEIVVERTGDTESITLKVELQPGAQSRKAIIEGQLENQLRLKTNLGYLLEFYEFGTLPRYEVKARRFKDLRNPRGNGDARKD
jgi:phenylacetate-CoA ligase